MFTCCHLKICLCAFPDWFGMSRELIYLLKASCSTLEEWEFWVIFMSHNSIKKIKLNKANPQPQEKIPIYADCMTLEISIL